jgi:hypothetical protein
MQKGSGFGQSSKESSKDSSLNQGFESYILNGYRANWGSKKRQKVVVNGVSYSKGNIQATENKLNHISQLSTTRNGSMITIKHYNDT